MTTTSVSYHYFVYRNRGTNVLQLVEREGNREEDGHMSYVSSRAKIIKHMKDSWNPFDWTLKVSNTLRNDEKPFNMMVLGFSQFVMVNKNTGERIRICKNKPTTALPSRGDCEIPVTDVMLKQLNSWINNPISITNIYE